VGASGISGVRPAGAQPAHPCRVLQHPGKPPQRPPVPHGQNSNFTNSFHPALLSSACPDPAFALGPSMTTQTPKGKPPDNRPWLPRHADPNISGPFTAAVQRPRPARDQYQRHPEHARRALSSLWRLLIGSDWQRLEPRMEPGLRHGHWRPGTRALNRESETRRPLRRSCGPVSADRGASHARGRVRRSRPSPCGQGAATTRPPAFGPGRRVNSGHGRAHVPCAGPGPWIGDDGPRDGAADSALRPAQAGSAGSAEPSAGTPAAPACRSKRRRNAARRSRTLSG